MKISVTGLGWYGSKLAEELQSEDHEICGTTRTLDKKKLLESKGFQVDLLDESLVPNQINDADIVILNIPPFEGQLQWFQKWPWNKNSWVIFISSTSVFPFPDSPSGKLLLDEEKWVQSSFEKWTIIRFGGLLGEDRHPGKYLSGRKNLPGRKWPVNLIHIDDCLGVTKAIIHKAITGKIIHAVGDSHPTREAFYTDYCHKKQISLPQFDPNDDSEGKLISNDEMKSFYRPKVRL
jgi:nucleoside-diphosphate-sugar epimerase